MKWRIYYRDGTTYSDCDGPVENAPAYGVIATAHEDVEPGPYNIGRVYRFGKNFYCLEQWGWTGRDDLHDYLGTPGWKKVLFGGETSASHFNRIKLRMEGDDYLKPRTTTGLWSNRG